MDEDRINEALWALADELNVGPSDDAINDLTREVARAFEVAQMNGHLAESPDSGTY
jgi:hypothetical protein